MPLLHAYVKIPPVIYRKDALALHHYLRFSVVRQVYNPCCIVSLKSIAKMKIYDGNNMALKVRHLGFFYWLLISVCSLFMGGVWLGSQKMGTLLFLLDHLCCIIITTGKPVCLEVKVLKFPFTGMKTDSTFLADLGGFPLLSVCIFIERGTYMLNKAYYESPPLYFLWD